MSTNTSTNWVEMTDPNAVAFSYLPPLPPPLQELISLQDIVDCVASHPNLAEQFDRSLCEAMFLDASSTRFASPTGVQPDSRKDRLNLDDIVQASGFRKRSHDKKWIPRRMREQWIALIQGLLPEQKRGRLFGPSSSPLFTPPALTSRERDSLNVSPIGFVSSRPSSPGSSLSGYFSTIDNNARGSRTLQKPRFVNASNNSLQGSRSLASLSGGSRSPIRREPSVSSLMLKRRPRSRADGRLSTGAPTDADSNSLAADIVRSTTPHSASFFSGRLHTAGSVMTGRSKMSSPDPFMSAPGSPIPPSTAMSTLSAASDFSRASGHSASLPWHDATSLAGSFAETPVFGFESQISHGKLKKLLMNSSELMEQTSTGLKSFEATKKKRSKPKQKPEYETICGRATVSKQWHKFLLKDAQQLLKDNKGWHNKTDAHEKRLIAQDREDRAYLRRERKKDVNLFFHPESIQGLKNRTCQDQQNFFGKSNQGTFRVDEEKPYDHEFRDWERLPVFYN